MAVKSAGLVPTNPGDKLTRVRGTRVAPGPPAPTNGPNKTGSPATSPDFMPYGDFVDPVFNHPTYAGTDPAYAAWLAGADLSATDATSTAKRRRADAQAAYKQAMADLATNATTSRRNLQTNMLQRGMFHSGEFDRRGMELNSAYDAAGRKAQGALTTSIGDINDNELSAIRGLGMQGTTQVSQAMLRDSVAQYNAQQQPGGGGGGGGGGSAPAPTTYAAPAAHPATYSPTVPAHPAYTPVTNSAGLYAAQSKPIAKPASGSTGALTQKRTGLQ